MINILKDYINSGDASESEIQLINQLKAEVETLSIESILKYLISKDEYRLADKIISHISVSVLDNQEVYFPIALIKMVLEKNEEAINCFEKYFSINELNSEAYYNYALVLVRIGKLNKATEELCKLISLDPENIRALNLLGELHLKQNNIEEAFSFYNKSLKVNPKQADTLYNVGSLYEGQLNFDDAIIYYSKTLELDNNHIQARWNRSLLYLREGDYIQGFADYEVRLKRDEIKRNDLTIKDWTGEDLTNQTLLIYIEQGYGDFFQYVRFIKLLRTRVKKIILEVKEELFDLMKSFLDADELYVKGGPIPKGIDFKVALMSLPHLLNIDRNNIINEVPYIFPQENNISSFKNKLMGYEYKIGFVWSGNKFPVGNRIRHTDFKYFNELIEQFPSITFVNLQLGDEVSELERCVKKNLIDVSQELNNFNDTAAAIKNLDLVITIDTAVAHLAGTLGKDTWLLMSKLPDWRWLLGEDYSIWYPTMKLYRQDPEGNWKLLFNEIAEDLQFRLNYKKNTDDITVEEIVTQFEKENSIFDNDSKALIKLVNYFWNKNKTQETDVIFKKIMNLKGTSKTILLKYAKFLNENCNYNKAIEILNKAVFLYPSSFEPYTMLAEIYAVTENNREAEFNYQKAMEKSKNDVAVIASYTKFLDTTINFEDLQNFLGKYKTKKDHKMNLTLSMIIKNEEKYLEGCLTSIKNLVDEIVIVDTGSEDKSIEIAKKYGAKVYNFEWIDDFSAARNFALNKSNGNWILYLDADERLSAKSLKTIKEIIKSDKNSGVFCNVISESDVAGNTNKMKYIRLFKNSPSIGFEGRVHEQIEKSLIADGYELLDSDIEIIHLGYDQDKETYNQKALRNLDLLLKDYQTNKDSYIAFQIGQTYYALNKTYEAIPFFNDVLKDPKLDNNYKLQTYRFLAAYYNEKDDLKSALSYIDKGLQINPEHHLLNIILADIFLKKGNVKKSSEYFLKGYNANKKLLNENASSVIDYAIRLDLIILRGVQNSLFSGDKSLFDFLKDEALSKIEDQDYIQLIKFVECLFDESSIDDLKQLSFNINKYLNFEMIGRRLKFITDLNKQKKILDIIAKTFSNLEQFQLYYADLLYTLNDFENAVIKYEKLYLTNKNPELILKLISVNLNLNRFENIKKLINEGQNLFKNHPTILAQLENIKSKLS